MKTQTPGTAAGTNATQLKRVLGTPSLTMFGLVYMVPLTVFTTYGLVTVSTGGRVAAAYIVTLVAMLFTARSYARMAGAYPLAGSAYVYTQRTFGPETGFLVGWALMLDYLFLPMVNYLVIGIYLNVAIPAIPAAVWVLVCIALVTVLNIVGITSVNRTNLVLIAAQAIFVVVFVVFTIAAMNGQAIDIMAPFRGDGSEAAGSAGTLMGGAAILCLSFLGFDAVSTLAEEAKDAERTVPKAIMIVTLAAGVIFVLLSWLAQVAHKSTEFADPDSAATEVMTAVGGTFLATLFTACYVAGALGSALTSQASVARILYSMGRDGVLPKPIFGRLNERFKSPATATLVVSAVSLLALVVDLAFIISVVSFGALIAFTFVNLSVIKHFYFDRQERATAWQHVNNGLLPLIGVALTVWLWTSLTPTTFAAGSLWVLLGAVVLAIVTKGFRQRAPMLDLKES